MYPVNAQQYKLLIKDIAKRHPSLQVLHPTPMPSSSVWCHMRIDMKNLALAGPNATLRSPSPMSAIFQSLCSSAVEETSVVWQPLHVLRCLWAKTPSNHDKFWKSGRFRGFFCHATSSMFMDVFGEFAARCWKWLQGDIRDTSWIFLESLFVEKSRN